MTCDAKTMRKSPKVAACRPPPERRNAANLSSNVLRRSLPNRAAAHRPTYLQPAQKVGRRTIHLNARRLG